MECLLPSEIARLVYGYLEEQKCEEAAQTFLDHSPHLSECAAVAKAGKKFSTRVLGSSLTDVLDEFCAVQTFVAERLRKLPEGAADQSKCRGGLVDKLKFLLDSAKPGQTVAVSISVLPHGGSPQASSAASAGCSRSRTPQADRKRASIRFQGQENRQRLKGKDDRSSALDCSPLDATLLEDLPGSSEGTYLSARKESAGGRAEPSCPDEPSVFCVKNNRSPVEQSSNEHLGSPNSEARVIGENPRTASPVPDNDARPEEKVTPKKKNHCQKESAFSPTKVSPAKVTNETAASLHRALLDDTELHEKIAENINRVLRNPSDGGSEDSEGVLQELHETIGMIVAQTEQDPVFQRFVDEIIGFADDDDEGSSPTGAESETDEGNVVLDPSSGDEVPNAEAANVPEEQCEQLEATESETGSVSQKDAGDSCRSHQSSDDGYINCPKERTVCASEQEDTEPEDAEEQCNPPLDIPLKQRLRNALNTCGSSKKRVPVTNSLEDENAAAIQSIVNAQREATEKSDPVEETSSLAVSSENVQSEQCSAQVNTKVPASQVEENKSRNQSTSQNQSTEQFPASDLNFSFAIDTPFKNHLLKSLEIPELDGSTHIPSDNDPILLTIPGFGESSEVRTQQPGSTERQPQGQPAVPEPQTPVLPEKGCPSKGVKEHECLHHEHRQQLVLTSPLTAGRLLQLGPLVSPVAIPPLPSPQPQFAPPPQRPLPLQPQPLQPQPLQPLFLQTLQPSIVRAPISPAPRSELIAHAAMTSTPSIVNRGHVIVCKADMKFPETLVQPKGKTLVQIAPRPSRTKSLLLATGLVQPKIIVTPASGGDSMLSRTVTSTASFVDQRKTFVIAGNLANEILSSELCKKISPNASVPVEQQIRIEVLDVPEETSPAVRVVEGQQSMYKDSVHRAAGDAGFSLPFIGSDETSPQQETSQKSKDSNTLTQVPKESITSQDRAHSEASIRIDTSALPPLQSESSRSDLPVAPSTRKVADVCDDTAATQPSSESRVVASREKETDVPLSRLLRDTPQTFVGGRSDLNPRSLSLSTPRRRASHIRTLDFGTPIKSGTEFTAMMKSLTSPKMLPEKRSQDSNSAKIIFPLSKQAKSVRSSLFKSPDPNSDVSNEPADALGPAVPAAPIATRSPAVPLQGGWDKAAGLGMIFGSPDQDVSRTSEGRSRLTPKTLLFSPESGSEHEEQAPACSSEEHPQQEHVENVAGVPGSSTQGNSTLAAKKVSSPVSKAQKTPKLIKSRAWDADLRAIMSRDYLEVVENRTLETVSPESKANLHERKGGVTKPLREKQRVNATRSSTSRKGSANMRSNMPNAAGVPGSSAQEATPLAAKKLSSPVSKAQKACKKYEMSRESSTRKKRESNKIKEQESKKIGEIITTNKESEGTNNSEIRAGDNVESEDCVSKESAVVVDTRIEKESDGTKKGKKGNKKDSKKKVETEVKSKKSSVASTAKVLEEKKVSEECQTASKKNSRDGVAKVKNDRKLNIKEKKQMETKNTGEELKTSKTNLNTKIEKKNTKSPTTSKVEKVQKKQEQKKENSSGNDKKTNIKPRAVASGSGVKKSAVKRKVPKASPEKSCRSNRKRKAPSKNSVPRKKPHVEESTDIAAGTSTEKQHDSSNNADISSSVLIGAGREENLKSTPLKDTSNNENDSLNISQPSPSSSLSFKSISTPSGSDSDWNNTPTTKEKHLTDSNAGNKSIDHPVNIPEKQGDSQATNKVILETPQKTDAKLCDTIPITPRPNAVPMTPRVLSPCHTELTPMTKIHQADVATFSMIVTPSLPPTPNIAISPESVTQGSPHHITRPTDYSSCSSYYNPSDSANTPSKSDEILGKGSSSGKQNADSQENQVEADISKLSGSVEKMCVDIQTTAHDADREIVNQTTTKVSAEKDTNSPKVVSSAGSISEGTDQDDKERDKATEDGENSRNARVNSPTESVSGNQRLKETYKRDKSSLKTDGGKEGLLMDKENYSKISKASEKNQSLKPPDNSSKVELTVQKKQGETEKVESHITSENTNMKEQELGVEESSKEGKQSSQKTITGLLVQGGQRENYAEGKWSESDSRHSTEQRESAECQEPIVTDVDEVERQLTILHMSSKSCENTADVGQPLSEVCTEKEETQNNNEEDDALIISEDFPDIEEKDDLEESKSTGNDSSDSSDSSSSDSSSDDSSRDSSYQSSRDNSVSETSASTCDENSLQSPAGASFGEGNVNVEISLNSEPQCNVEVPVDNSTPERIKQILQDNTSEFGLCSSSLCTSSELDKKRERTLKMLKASPGGDKVENKEMCEVKKQSTLYDPVSHLRDQSVEKSTQAEVAQESSEEEIFPSLHLSDGESISDNTQPDFEHADNKNPQCNKLPSPVDTVPIDTAHIIAVSSVTVKKSELQSSKEAEEDGIQITVKDTVHSSEGKHPRKKLCTQGEVSSSESPKDSGRRVNEVEEENVASGQREVDDPLENPSELVCYIGISYADLGPIREFVPPPDISNVTYALPDEEHERILKISPFQELLVMDPCEKSRVRQRETVKKVQRSESDSSMGSGGEKLPSRLQKQGDVGRRKDKSNVHNKKLRPLAVLYKQAEQDGAGKQSTKPSERLHGKNPSAVSAGFQYQSPLEDIHDYRQERRAAKVSTYQANWNKRCLQGKASSEVKRSLKSKAEKEEGEISDGSPEKLEDKWTTGHKRPRQHSDPWANARYRRSRSRSPAVLSSRHPDRHTGPSTSRDIHSLPPKKRKTAETEEVEGLEKRVCAAPSEIPPQLRNLDIDVFLSKLHGRDDK